MRLRSGGLGSLLVRIGSRATWPGSAHGSALKPAAWTPRTSKLVLAPAAYIWRMNSLSGMAWSSLVWVGGLDGLVARLEHARVGHRVRLFATPLAVQVRLVPDLVGVDAALVASRQRGQIIGPRPGIVGRTRTGPRDSRRSPLGLVVDPRDDSEAGL